mmetsp:Transcript_836/g.1900  ORF Transcript_836/g.1900 Transcript_836/m.1900 type:complete len:159 (+) Transcript_836:492-968(+)
MDNMEQELYRCYYDRCTRTYSSKYNLRRHVNSTHLRIRSFTCEKCDKKFTSKQSLKEHFYIHTGEKPFTCFEIGCNKRFRQASQLNVHRKKVHMLATFATVKRSEANASLQHVLGEGDSEYLAFCFQRELPALNDERRDIQHGAKMPVLPILLNGMRA